MVKQTTFAELYDKRLFSMAGKLTASGVKKGQFTALLITKSS